MNMLGVIVLALCVPSLAQAVAERGMNSSGVYVKALGKSGKIVVAPGKDLDGNADRVVIEMDSVEEIDSEGNAFTGGSTKHSFKTFANQDFTIGSLQLGNLQGVNCSYFSFAGQLKDLSSSVTVTVRNIKDLLYNIHIHIHL